MPALVLAGKVLDPPRGLPRHVPPLRPLGEEESVSSPNCVISNETAPVSDDENQVIESISLNEVDGSTLIVGSQIESSVESQLEDVVAVEPVVYFELACPSASELLDLLGDISLNDYDCISSDDDTID